MHIVRGFPGGSVVKNPSASVGDGVPSMGQEDPLEKEMATTRVFSPGKSQGERRLTGNSSWGRKELDWTKQLNSSNSTHC